MRHFLWRGAPQSSLLFTTQEFSVKTSSTASSRSIGLFGTTRRETILLIAAVVALLTAIFGPSVAQHAHYHAFADQRELLGVPFAMDVLSNLPFAIAGLLGLIALGRAPALPQRAYVALFFGGLIVTTVGSIIYHLNPNDGTLAIDRLGMVAGFAGMLGLAAMQRISQRAGVVTAATVLLLGPIAVAVWASSGNLLPWALLQGGAMVMLLVLALCRPLYRPFTMPASSAARLPTVSLLPVIAFYVAAKLCELGDHQIFELTNHAISGHSLKHIVAALAAWPVLAALAGTQSRQSTVHNTAKSQSPATRRTPRIVQKA
jgi:hypothetical protein